MIEISAVIIAIVGWGLTVLTLVGGAIMRDRQITLLIHAGDVASEKRIKEDTDALHERVNAVIRDYVRRDDLANHIHTLDRTIQALALTVTTSNSEMTRRVDGLTAAIIANGGKYESST